MKHELDELLKSALTPTDTPDARLNKRIIHQVKEQEGMKKQIWKRIPATVLTVAIVLNCAFITVAARAVAKYLSPRNVAEKTEDSKLADAFSGEDAIIINETQSFGGYNVTLLGIVSGKDLSESKIFSDKIQLEDRTYSVVAIEHANGTPMAEVGDAAFDDETFFVSPLVRDYNPMFYNAFLFNGAYEEFVENGIRYRLVECDNVEMFAGHGLYLCVCDGGSHNTKSYNSEAYQFDEATGIISRNKDYNGLNALFDLPIDASKADSEAIKDYLESLEMEEESMPNPDKNDKDKWRHQITPENIDIYADRLEDSVQVITPDEEGLIHYKYVDADGNLISKGYTTMLNPDEKFIIKGFTAAGRTDDGRAEAHINTLQLNDDGTVTYACYSVKQEVLEH